MLSLKNLSLQIKGHKLFENFSLDIKPGERWVVLGKNGAGKTSLLKTLTGLVKNFSGDIFISGQSINSLGAKIRARYVGLVLQENTCEFPVTVAEYIAHGLYPQNGFNASDSDVLIEKVLRDTQLTDFADRMVSSLSGGEMKRAALATLLVQSPSIIFLDEPLNHLDLQYQTFMLDLFNEKVKTENNILFMSLHDINMAYKYADKVILMWGDGRVSSGEVEHLMTPENLSELYGVEVREQAVEKKKLFYTV